MIVKFRIFDEINKVYIIFLNLLLIVLLYEVFSNNIKGFFILEIIINFKYKLLII